MRSRVPLNKSQTAETATVPAAVFLVGFMGAGKSSVGRALGQRLNWIFEDLDDRIERRQGQSVTEIFGSGGEQAFRRAERAALQEVLEDLPRGPSRIIALGGGAFVQKRNAALLKAAGAPTIFLDAPVEELWRRCQEQAKKVGAQRPLLGSTEQFCALYDARRNGYSKASLRIETGSRSVEEIANEIARTLGLSELARRHVSVRREGAND
jgi:shikimate kinase